MNILLDDVGLYEVAGNRVTVSNDQRVAVYTLPKGSRRVIVEKAGRGQSRLILGGFTKATVMVTGPTKIIERLREAVL